jgi:hypothetical protein
MSPLERSVGVTGKKPYRASESAITVVRLFWTLRHLSLIMRNGAIQAAMAKVLNEIDEQDFLKCSFGFRPGLGCDGD